MREIKFRCWNEWADRNEMVYFTLDTAMIFENCTTNAKVMEYTGLKDNNGKDIYEGDILRTTEENGIDTFIDTFKIVWDADKGGFMIEYLNNDEYYNLEEMPDCIIIGNVYE